MSQESQKHSNQWVNKLAVWSDPAEHIVPPAVLCMLVRAVRGYTTHTHTYYTYTYTYTQVVVLVVGLDVFVVVEVGM